MTEERLPCDACGEAAVWRDLLRKTLCDTCYDDELDAWAEDYGLLDETEAAND